MRIQCCKCHRVRTGRRWSEKPFLPTTNVSYTYCPACMAEAIEEFAAEGLRTAAAAS